MIKRSKMRFFRLVILSVLIVILSVVLNYFDDKIPTVDRQIKNLTAVLHRKIDLTYQLIGKTGKAGKKDLQLLIKETEKNDVIIQVYEDDNMVFWTSNSVSAIPVRNLTDGEIKIKKISNTWYTVQCSVSGNEKYIGLVPLKSEYPYENKFLYSGFIERHSNPFVQFCTHEKHPIHSLNMV